MIRDAMFALLLTALCCCLGCGGDAEPTPPNCEVYGVEGAVRCFYDGGAICYVGLDDYPGCQCNGPGGPVQPELCAMTLGFADGGSR